jgi:phospho-N-acetylmuramoyl-pentapeptide-transferase
MTLIAIDVIKILVLGFTSFLIAFFLVPPLTHFLYKYKLWEERKKEKSIDGQKLIVTPKIHAPAEKPVPRFGGLLIWMVPLIVSFFFLLLAQTGIPWLEKLNFLGPGQTWLPLAVLVGASLLGLLDDWLQVRKKGKYVGGGLSLSWRIFIMGAIALFSAWWFYNKLGMQSLHIPGNGDFFLGWWYIPIFVLVMLAVYSGGVIDGIDGLAGGTFVSIFSALAVIAFAGQQINLAAFCMVLVGALLAFLWFNIPPARFYLGETGIMGLCALLTVVTFFTDSLVVLPIIALLLVVESASVILQLLSKKLRKKKLFLVSPIHYHFEAKGWPHYKVTMRFWVIGFVSAILGVIIRLLG